MEKSIIIFQINKEDREKIKEKAKQNNKTVSSYCREILLYSIGVKNEYTTTTN